MKKIQFDLIVLETQILFEAVNNLKQYNHHPSREIVGFAITAAGCQYVQQGGTR